MAAPQATKTRATKTGGKPSLRGRFVTFEGIDGCGKTTQARRLAERLRGAGLPVRETREPGGTEVGRQLRAVLLNPDNAALEPACELLLYLADRVQHLRETILPALARGDVVLCDRFHDATVAYQGHGRGLDLAPLRAFIAGAVLSRPPDVTFWLELPVSLAQARTLSRGGGRKDRLEAGTPAFHERVRAGYAAIAAAEPERVVRIDAVADEDHVAASIWDALRERYDAL